MIKVNKIVGIETLALALGMTKVEKTLPNGKVISAFEYAPAQLPDFFKAVEAERLGLGRDDLIVLDGGCPYWMLPCLAHAVHPASCAVKYPQGGPDAVAPVSGFQQGVGAAEGVTFEVVEAKEFTKVTFALAAASIDLPRALATLTAPSVREGLPVRISGRGPIALAAALGDAYAHRVSEVSFDRGDGKAFIVSISHGGRDLGTVIEA